MQNARPSNSDPPPGSANVGARPPLWRRLGSAKYDLVALFLLIAGVTFFHWRGIRPGRTFLPIDLANNTPPWLTELHGLQNWLISDPLWQFYPFLAHAVKTIQTTGAWPLWNPYIFLGHPIAGDPLMQTFYPFFIALGLLLGAARGLAIGLWLHVLLAGVLTYGLLRSLRCNWRAALLGAFTYALGGYLVTWFETLFWVATLTWLPGVLWMFELSLKRRNLAYAALAGLALGLAILGGQFMFLVTFGLFLVLWALGRTWEAARAHEPGPAWPLLALALAGITGALVGAAQIVPFAEFLGTTRRVIGRGLTSGLPWQQLVTLVIPNFYGNPAVAAGANTNYWGMGNYAESTIYGGLVALLLACAAPFSTRRFRTWYLFGLALALVYFVLGGPGIELMGAMPVLKYASLPRSTFLLPLIIAMLAALGLSAPELRPRAVLGVAITLIVWVAIGWWLNWGNVQAHRAVFSRFVLHAAVILGVAVTLLLARARWRNLLPLVDLCLVALVFADLFLWGARFNPAGTIARLMPRTPVIDFLATRPGDSVVQPYHRGDLLIGPNILSLYGISEAGGYSSLVDSDYYELIAGGDPKLDIWWLGRGSNIVGFSRPTDRLEDLMRINFAVTQEPWGEPEILAEQVVESCAGDSGEVNAANPVSGSFQVRAAAINRVDVRLRPAPGVRPGTALMLRLWRGAEHRLIAEVRRDLKQESGEQSLAFYFAPEREAPGQVYTWEISAAEGASPGVAVCRDEQGRPAISVYGTEGYQVFADGPYVFERFSALPRAFVVYAAELAGDDAAATARLLDPSFDVRNVVLTSDPSDLPATVSQPATRARVTSSEDHRVVVEAHAERPGMLVLDDQYHPGWQAWLDGKPAGIQRVNQFMRGVALPAGEHRVEFIFAPMSVKIGVGLNIIGLLLVAALVVFARRSTMAPDEPDRRDPH